MHNNEIYIVLGMHKSGTTLVANLLHGAGISMVEKEEEKEYRQGNKYERISTNILNKDLLGAKSTKSIYLREKLVTEQVERPKFEAAEKLASEINRETDGVWGFKDPRTCLTYDFWKRVIPHHKAIVVTREPRKVHDHYAGWKLFGFRDGINALLAWQAYNELLLDYLRHLPREKTIVIDYGMLVSGDSEFSRLERFVGRKFADRRSKSRRRKPLDFGLAYAVNLFIVENFYRKKVRQLYRDLLDFRETGN